MENIKSFTYKDEVYNEGDEVIANGVVGFIHNIKQLSSNSGVHFSIVSNSRALAGGGESKVGFLYSFSCSILHEKTSGDFPRDLKKVRTANLEPLIFF